MPPETADVVIVVACKDDAPDLDRIGHRETYPYPQARSMVETGEARWVDDPRNADDRWPIDDDQPDGDESGEVVNLPAADPKPLADMSESQLRGIIPGGAGLPESTTRDELLAYARNLQQSGVEPEAEPQPTRAAPDMEKTTA